MLAADAEQVPVDVERAVALRLMQQSGTRGCSGDEGPVSDPAERSRSISTVLYRVQIPSWPGSEPEEAPLTRASEMFAAPAKLVAIVVAFCRIAVGPWRGVLDLRATRACRIA
jgi:hypothetical protein